MKKPSLYQRLGGYDKITAIVETLFEFLSADARLARFAGGRSNDSNRRLRQLLIEQICSLSGGPCYYTGRDMKTAHSGLGITTSEWDANLELTREALLKNGIAGTEQEEFLSLLVQYRHEIVEDPRDVG